MKDIDEILSAEPAYRRDQIYRAWFNPEFSDFNQITTLPKELRDKLSAISWISVRAAALNESRNDETKKALLVLADGATVETVLMGRLSKKIAKKEDRRYTICVSSQVGCAMKCSFCATGMMGFKRNLSAMEIIDQYRFWQKYLAGQGEGRIDNIVFMGQGEPLANYDAVKESIAVILKYTDIGPTKITISTGGAVNGMKRMVEDIDFPPVRFALSLHSAIPDDRKKLIPSQPPDFFDFLISWSKKYHARFPSRTHFLGLEYLFIKGINDSRHHLKALIKLASKLGRVRLNLIPYNEAGNSGWRSAPIEEIKKWRDELMAAGFTATVRLSQGGDIAAACGQLQNIYDVRQKK